MCYLNEVVSTYLTNPSKKRDARNSHLMGHDNGQMSCMDYCKGQPQGATHGQRNLHRRSAPVVGGRILAPKS